MSFLFKRLAYAAVLAYSVDFSFFYHWFIFCHELSACH